MTSQRDTFDPANVPTPENMGERRGYIDQYIQRFHSDLVPRIEEKRKASYPIVCKHYHEQRGQIEVPSVYFEYVVDKTMWKNIFKPLGGGATPAWPWEKGPEADDMSDGMSNVYREWRIENGLPIATPQQEADNSSDHLINRVKNPVVVDQALREALWLRCFGPNQHTGFIRGPFALNLPVWVDFENLVLGDNGRDIDAINDRIVEPGLVVSWEIYNAAPLGLVVPLGLVIGFKDEASQTLPQVQRNLITLWCDVVAWFCEAVAGGTVSLASYLRVIQVTSYALQRTPAHEQAHSSWERALQAPQHFASQARERRETLKKWAPMVKQIIKKPFGEAEQELGTWIWSNDADLVEREIRLAIVREIWLYGSSKPEVIRRAFNWLTYFSTNLDPSI
ncbi:uncharacterized protein FRV6_11998 [Fusarium oxysporum]|uniref:Uncharacterized protein n=1 Tax=Fusarium oxysporum TaxID=5507 RepID=A0A2H3TQ57_FUSOX|nr:uncharacterized protein FRV6_11998 [Fusarium oxysporum]